MIPSKLLFVVLLLCILLVVGCHGGRDLDFTYDDADRLKTIEESSAVLAAYSYAGVRPVRRDYGNGTRTDIAYNGISGAANAAGDLGVGRIKASTHTVIAGGAVIDSRGFEWDALGNKTQRKDLRSGGPEYTFDYTYDALSRMTESARVSGPTIGYTLDDAGNREEVDNNGTPEQYALAPSMNQYVETPFDSEILHDEVGNLSSIDTRAKIYTYDARDRLTGYIIAATREHEAFDGALGEEYEELLGTWAIVDGSLKQTDASMAGGRILRTLDAGTERFAFSYKTPHDPEDEETYDPEYYALALLRVDETATPEWGYIALVIEPNRIVLREWEEDALLQEALLAEDTTVVTEANEWYEVEIRYGAIDLEVYHAKRGNPFPEEPKLALEGLTVTSGSKVGFGVGTDTDFAFDNLIATDAEVDLLQASFQYDALGRRIAKSEYLNGVHQNTTYFYYDGHRIIEERDGTTGTVEATYVYGNYIDEVLQMQRDSEDYYYHTDDLHNVVAITDDTGTVEERYDYGDFGLPTTLSAIGNSFYFNGQRYDQDLGLYHYRARYMDPNTGRFVQRDPIGVWGDGANLGNGYAYAGNNPWSRVDPFGKFGAAPGVSEYYLAQARNAGNWNQESAGDMFVLSVGQSLVGIGTLGFTGAEPLTQAREIDRPGATGFESYVYDATLTAEVTSVAASVPGIAKGLVRGGAKVVRWTFRKAWKTPVKVELAPPNIAIDEVWQVRQHGEMPSPRPVGTEAHHGVSSVWMQANYPKYSVKQAPSILMRNDPNHNLTRGVFNRIRMEIAKDQGVSPRAIDWTRVSAGKMWRLAEEQLDAARVPLDVRKEYFKAVNSYLDTLR